MLNEVNKIIGLQRKLKSTLPRLSSLRIRPHLDYGDVIYDQAYNAKFLENFQYHAALAITVTTRGASKDKLFGGLGFELLQHRRWYGKLYFFYKILKEQSSKYIFDVIPKIIRPYFTRNANNIPNFKVKHNFFNNTFFFVSHH